MLDQAYSRRQFLGLAGGLASIVGLGLVGCGGAGATDAADKGSAAAAESVSGEVTYDAPPRSRLSSRLLPRSLWMPTPTSPSPVRATVRARA